MVSKEFNRLVRKLAKDLISLLTDDSKLTLLRSKPQSPTPKETPKDKKQDKAKKQAKGDSLNDKQFNHYRLDKYLNELRDDFRTVGEINPQSFKILKYC